VSEFLREKRFKTRSVAGTLAMGERVLEMLSPVPKLIVLRGDLGAGKTTLVKDCSGPGCGGDRGCDESRVYAGA
jgi:Threonylcarbamoyl adenosine biosynthesis protein TsaE